MARRRRQGFGSQPRSALPGQPPASRPGSSQPEAAELLRPRALHASTASAQEQRALQLLQQGHHAEAEQLLLQLIAAGSAPASAYCNLAAIHGMGGRTSEMIALLEQALRLNPNYPEALSNLGIAYQDNGQLQKAMESYRRALRLRPDYAEALCNLGSALQESGDHAAALEAYEKAIACKPDYPEALTNLALLHRATGEHRQAIELCRRALALRPHHPEALLCLIQALRDSGDRRGAIAACRQALTLQPELAELHLTLGNLLKQQGELDEAIVHYRRALQLQPSAADALVNLGDILKEQQHYTEAIACFQQALSLRPDFPEALSNLGIVHQMLEDGEAAIEAYRRAIALAPEFAAAHSNLGISLSELGDYGGAIVCFREAIRLEPDFAEAYSNLGIALEETGDLDDAIDAYNQALKLQPHYPEAFCNLGNALQEKGEIEACLAAYQRAVELRSDYADARKNLSMALLLSGDYVAGWQAYEWRFRSQKGLAILNALPTGALCEEQLPPAGESLLLVSEQGYGDTLQFMRYLLPLRQRGVAVRLCAPTKLHSLIQVSGLDAAPLAPEQVHAQPLGAWMPLLSLPRHLGVSAADPLVCEPYLRTTEALCRKWQALLAEEPRPIIALNWQGNPEHEKSTSKGRSLPLKLFAPIAEIEGLSLLSLQKGHGSEQLERCSFRDRFVRCQDLVSDTWDFLETAAIIANCDLVITSDTSAAHLAAGLGQTTWLLLKHIAEWRWGLAGEHSAWYPCMRLFRQRQAGNWAEVIERVAASLRQLPPQALIGRFAVATAEVEPEHFAASALLPVPSEANRPEILQIRQLLQQGQSQAAEALCRQLLNAGARNGEVSGALQLEILELLAGLCEASGRHGEQLQLLRQAMALQPPSARMLYNLAVALQQQGQIEEAISIYQQALELQPDFPEALGNLGVALHGQGQLDQAIEVLERAVAFRPDFAGAYSNLGNAWQAKGEPEQAIAAYHQALALDPDFAEVLSNLATALKEIKDYDAAEEACRRALRLRPSYPEALSNLGNILQARGDIDAAIDCYRQAIALKSDYANAHYNLGIALKELDDLEGAVAAYQWAISLQPNYPNAHSNLGNAWQEMAEVEKAIAAYEQALTYNREHPAANKNLSMALLLKGDYRQGWPRYEWRFQDEPGLDLLFARPSTPRWDGSPLPAGTVLTLVGEQGLGDVLQFMRYVLPLRQRGVAVSLCAVQKLHGLIQASGIDAAPLTPSQAQGLAEGVWLPLLSLPQFLEVTAENPLVTDPYIATTQEHRARWQALLDREEGPIIALNWQGNPEHETTNSRGRSLPLETFAPLAGLAGVRFLSLQKGHGSEQLESCSFRDRFVSCQPQVDAAWDFLDTAAIIACCDLVITSDTSVVHLAGGLGKTTWLLLKDVPEWRWGLSGETSFWYPSLRLFRQRRHGDWAEVMQRVALALQEFCYGVGQADPAQPPCQIAVPRPPTLSAVFPALVPAVVPQTGAVAGSAGGPRPSAPALSASAPQGPARSFVSAEALAQTGLDWQERGELERARQAYVQALQLRPDFPEALSNLGLVLQKQGQLDAAIDHFQRALAMQPQERGRIQFNLGAAYQQRGDLEQAVAAYRIALEQHQPYPKALNNLGVCLQELADLEGAIATLRQALDQQSDYHEARTNLAMALLLAGRYPEGWELYNRRFEAPQRSSLLAARPPLPLWNGQRLGPDASLLLVAEQGLGDTLQFMRYLPLLRHHGVAVSLCADLKLHGVIQASGIDPAPLTPSVAQHHRRGVWLPLLSLPQHLGVSASEPRVSEPYIHTPPQHLARWQALLAQEPRPIVAINWQGNPDHETTNSRGRSLPLEVFAPLAQIGGLRLLSLQKGPGSEQLASCSFRDRFVSCQAQVDTAWDFLDTAAILACCDLVITSDTAVAHLAGGLGRPTWLLLKDIPEWRWGLQGDRTAWYPSMRLFRQQRRGDWQELMQRVMLALQLHFGWATQPAPWHPDARTAVRQPDAPAAMAEAAPSRLSKAEALFAAGRWAEAEGLYRDLIHTDPGDAQLLHRLGQLCGLNGRFREMAEWLEKALQIRPEDPAALGNLGLAYQELGNHEAALETYGRSLRLRPNAPDVLTNQGTVWQARGDLAAAIGCYRQALALNPHHAEAHCNLGLALQEQGEDAAALEAYQEAIRCKPDGVKAHYNLACLHYAKQRLELAIQAYQEVIRIQPQFAEAYTSLGNAYKQAGDLEAAIAAYHQGLELRPEHADTLCNLGNSHLVRSELPVAIACFERALASDPGHARTLHNLGIALQEQGDAEAAIAAFRSSISRDPDFAEAHGALAMALLLVGEYRQGWQEYEWRFRCQHGPHLLTARPDLPRWEGQPLAPGSPLLLVSEQGLGDTLQFLRYGLHLQHQGVQVHLCAPSKLHGLIQLSGLETSPLTPEQAAQLTVETLPQAHWLPLLSLPGLLGVTPDDPLVCDPYLRSSEERIEAWRQHLAAEQRPIVAIHWQGNPEHEQTTSMGRSLPLETFAPLAHLEGLSLLSLQKGHGAEQLESCSFRHRFVGCQDLVSATWDFVDTAAIVANCDLVITSDTALAHLAAGMGQPTWLLLKHTPEWRWGLAGERSFWYPSLWLFRQRSRGDWGEVMERVAGKLADRSVQRPD